jgi:hypothetical protein
MKYTYIIPAILIATFSLHLMAARDLTNYNIEVAKMAKKVNGDANEFCQSNKYVYVPSKKSFC